MAKRTSVNLPSEPKKALFIRAVELGENLQDLTGPAASFFAKIPGNSLAEVESNAERALILLHDALEEDARRNRQQGGHQPGAV